MPPYHVNPTEGVLSLCVLDLLSVMMPLILAPVNRIDHDGNVLGYIDGYIGREL